MVTVPCTLPPRPGKHLSRAHCQFLCDHSIPEPCQRNKGRFRARGLFIVGRSGTAVRSLSLGGSHSPWAQILPWTLAMILRNWLHCHGPQCSHLPDEPTVVPSSWLSMRSCVQNSSSRVWQTGNGSHCSSRTCCCDPPYMWLCSV